MVLALTHIVAMYLPGVAQAGAQQPSVRHPFPVGRTAVFGARSTGVWRARRRRAAAGRHQHRCRRCQRGEEVPRQEAVRTKVHTYEATTTFAERKPQWGGVKSMTGKRVANLIHTFRVVALMS